MPPDVIGPNHEAVRVHGSISKAARVMGISRRTLQHRLDTERKGKRVAAIRGLVGGPPIPEVAIPPEGFVIRRNSGQYDANGNLQRQWIETAQGNTDGYSVPEGHVVKGESVLLDANDNVIVKWIKTKEGAGEGLIDALRQTFAEFDGAAPRIPLISDCQEDDILTVYPLPDLHFGMLAWGRETGESYDIKIATEMALDAVARLVGQSRPSRHAVLLGLGDYFHANDARAVTPGSGHQLDVDARWPKVFKAGAELATKMVDMIARKHHDVEVVFLPGNHDPDAAMSLTVALALFYSQNDRIHVHQDPGILWYRRFGSVLLGGTHGHTLKPAKMPITMAADRPDDWGKSRHRHIFFGHIHHETVVEEGGVRCESFSAPTAKDAWNAARFRAGRALSAITFHQDDGEIGRHRVAISQPHMQMEAA